MKVFLKKKRKLLLALMNLEGDQLGIFQGGEVLLKSCISINICPTTHKNEGPQGKLSEF